jgi:hypothetical protein
MLKIGYPHQNAGLPYSFEKNFTDGAVFSERDCAFEDGLPPLAPEREGPPFVLFARIGSRSDSGEKPLPCPVIDSTRASSGRTHEWDANEVRAESAKEVGFL